LTLIVPIIVEIPTAGQILSVIINSITFTAFVFVVFPFLYPASVFLLRHGLWLSRLRFRKCFGLERLVGILGSQFWSLSEGAYDLLVDKTFSYGVTVPFQVDLRGSNHVGELLKVSYARLDAT